MAPGAKAKRGRPTIFKQRLADKICARMQKGESLRSICRDDGMPDECTVRMWAVSDREGFYTQYTRAREAQMDAMAEDLLEIADDARNDWMERHGEDDAGWMVNGEHVARARLRLDTRKWLMSKIAPKRFGDRTHHEMTGRDGGPIQTQDLTHYTDERLAALAALLRQDSDAGGSEGGDPAPGD